MFDTDESNGAAQQDNDTTVPPPLVGEVGRQFIREKLADNSKKPQAWLAEIRERGALKNPACAPLMILLQQQGMASSSAHKEIFERV
jgi:hypothetical protein